MSQTTCATLAVAVTVQPPADAVRVIGPHVFWDGLSTYIQFGIPTNPTDPGLASGTIPTSIARSCIDATA